MHNSSRPLGAQRAGHVVVYCGGTVQTSMTISTINFVIHDYTFRLVVIGSSHLFDLFIFPVELQAAWAEITCTY